MRNTLFDIGLLKSTPFAVPIISVGNISVGGTGKTPMIEYLIRHLTSEYTIAVLSRGYGRKSKGFRWVLTNDNVSATGDEPLQIKSKFNDILVAVCENRVDGVKQMLSEHPDINLILLDDAFQHRSISPSLQILLTPYSKPFYNDWILPVGNLRESRRGVQRADALIYTKCPEHFKDKRSFDKPTFYSQIQYSNVNINGPIYGFSGLANNGVFQHYLNAHYSLAGFKSFPDHYAFTNSDIEALVKLAENCTLVCTEKDWTKIKEFSSAKAIQHIKITNIILGERSLIPWIKEQINHES